MRQGECFGLTVDRIDFLRQTITVDRQLILPATGSPQFGPPNTAASVRTVRLPNVVAESVAGHVERWPADSDALIFTNGRCDPLRRNRFGEIWRAAVSRAGLDGLRFHDLRHFSASLLIRHGESVKVVQARLGHASASETRHLLPPLARQRGTHANGSRRGTWGRPDKRAVRLTTRWPRQATTNPGRV